MKCNLYMTLYKLYSRSIKDIPSSAVLPLAVAEYFLQTYVNKVLALKWFYADILYNIRGNITLYT